MATMHHANWTPMQATTTDCVNMQWCAPFAQLVAHRSQMRYSQSSHESVLHDLEELPWTSAPQPGSGICPHEGLLTSCLVA
eukprot:358752-Chlamydomonas_euryale.AAC.28